MTADDEADWKAIRKSAKAHAKTLERKAEKAIEQEEQNKLTGFDSKKQIPRVVDVPSEPVTVHASTQLLIDHIEGFGGGRYDTVGALTTETWRLNQGVTSVFQRPAKNRGRTVVMTDFSASMRCWCDECRVYRVDNDRKMSNGWLAMQVTGAVSMATDGEAFGYTDVNSTSNAFGQSIVFPIPQGHQPLPRHQHHDGVAQGNTPTESALAHLADMLGGETGDALGVLVTDGAPNNPDAVRSIAARLNENGVEYVVVIVANKGVDARFREYIRDLFQTATIVEVTNEDDLGGVGEAIAGIVN